MKVCLIIAALFATCHCKIEFSDRARNFSVELLYFTAEETEWHTVISPFGVWSLLAAASTGATKSSRQELIRTLILPKNEDTLFSGYKSLKQSVFKPIIPKVELKFMNYMFVESKYTIKPDFSKNLQNNFGTKIAKLSFKPANEAQKIANDIVKKCKIINTDVFKSSDFDNSQMILSNVISFKAIWQIPFNETNTKIESFYDESGKEAGKVNMMFQEESFAFSRVNSIKATVIELPYGEEYQSKYTFLIFLPLTGETVASVFKELNNVTLVDIFAKLESDTKEYGMPSVLLSLPRFKISSNIVLNRPLYNMGIADIFDSSKASFKSITNDDDIYVSAIVHKADIEVTEVGTVASASTSVYFSNRITPSTFNANRPFIYFIVEKTTTTILFGGVYSKPSIY